MRCAVRCAFAIFITLQPGLSIAGQPSKSAPGPATAPPEFKALIDRYYAAWNTGNPDNASPLYAKDPNLIFYDLTPLKYTGWSEYDRGIRNVLASFASAKFTPQPDLNVTRHGTIAWTTVTWHLSGKKKSGEAVELDGRHTAIWENRHGHWLIVHEHFSAPLP
jgi:ketosteroid isomerase-like protein